MAKETKYGEEEILKARLEAWENPSSGRDYTVEISFPEFTCLCPRSGYPDFATIRVTYVPDEKIVELKALKLYLNAFRERSISHEEVVSLVFEDLNALLQPKELNVVGDFNPRGNVKTVVRMSL